MSVRLREHPGVALGIRLAHEHVAHRAQPPGPRPGARGRLEQRHELEPERAPAEREHLGDDHARAQLLEQRQQPIAAQRAEAVVDRPVVLVQQAREGEIARAHRGSWTSSTPPPTSQGAGVPPLAMTTRRPRSLIARARVAARFRCPLPSRCWTQNRTGVTRIRPRAAPAPRARPGRPDGSAARSPWRAPGGAAACSPCPSR